VPRLLIASLPKGKNEKLPMTKHPAPRDADDGDVGNDPRQPPGQPQEDSAKNEPQKIENRAHGKRL